MFNAKIEYLNNAIFDCFQLEAAAMTPTRKANLALRWRGNNAEAEPPSPVNNWSSWNQLFIGRSILTCTPERNSHKS